jgi:chemosensory pili system protein ChpB (putative protein-glutamate methylesterase)
MEFTGEDLSLSDEPLLLVDEPEAWQPPAHVHDAELIDDAGELHLEPESGAASEPAPSRMVEPPALPPELPAKPVSAGMNLELVEADDAPVHSPASVAPVAILPFGDIGLEPEVPDGVPAASIPAPPQAVPEPTTPESASNPATQTVQGAVLLFAGIGGPDAVRRILAELPANFPRPVLLCMRLDGGRYDNLIKQLGRVSLMPVQMALAGETAQHARVYVVPDDVSVQIDDGSARFEVGTTVQQQLIAALPAAQSSVLLLSGSDASCVGPALALAAQGAYVAGQSLQGCYDPAASKALMMRGGVIGAPSALAAGVVRHG